MDAILISAVLAGIKRSTGLTPKTRDIESKDIRSVVDRYLGLGEWVMDVSIGYVGGSSYFERRRFG